MQALFHLRIVLFPLIFDECNTLSVNFSICLDHVSNTIESGLCPTEFGVMDDKGQLHDRNSLGRDSSVHILEHREE